MVIKISILIASVLQVLAAVLLSIGTFQTGDRPFPVFIQPSGWAFSIWGLIYTLSFIYAVYQLIPRNDNATLRATRVPALVGFLSSIAWLYLAGTNDWQLWLTAPVLFIMALVFIRVVTAPEGKSVITTLLSKQILFPYAAWTGIAAWLNVQTLLVEQSLVVSDASNVVSNLFLFACVAVFTLYFFRRSGYSLWYGGVLVWASIGVIDANLNDGSMIFVVLASLLLATVVLASIKKELFT